MSRNFTEKEDQFLRDNYLTIPAKRMSKMLGRSESASRQRMKLLGITVPADVVEKFKKESRFKAGQKVWNKGVLTRYILPEESKLRMRATQFKKGNKPYNTKAGIGFISIRADKSGLKYQYIKMADGKWDLLHRHIWEKTFGPIPKGFIVAFKDRDTLNADPENLELITRVENMKRNTIHNYPENIVKTVHLRGVLNRKINSKLKKLNDEK